MFGRRCSNFIFKSGVTYLRDNLYNVLKGSQLIRSFLSSRPAMMAFFNVSRFVLKSFKLCFHLAWEERAGALAFRHAYYAVEYILLELVVAFYSWFNCSLVPWLKQFRITRIYVCLWHVTAPFP